MGRAQYLGAIATLTGCMIGAGIFALPYAVAQAGFLTGLFIILLLGIGTLIIHLYVGEVCLRTHGTFPLTTLAGFYRGNQSKIAMRTAMILGIYGGLIAYIIGEGHTISSLTGLSPFIGILIFLTIFGAILYFDVNVLGRVELIIVSLIALLTIGLFSFSMSSVSPHNLALFEPSQLFAPFGVVLFAYAGVVAIVEMKEEIGDDPKKMKSAIIIGSGIPIVLYTLFAFVVVGVTGESTTPVATVGLAEAIGGHALVFGNLFVIAAMGTSFLTNSFALKEVFWHDYGFSKNASWALVLFPPALIAISGLSDFISTLDITGALASGMIYILAVLMHRNAKHHGSSNLIYSIRSSTILTTLFVLLFLAGMAYQVVHFI